VTLRLITDIQAGKDWCEDHWFLTGRTKKESLKVEADYILKDATEVCELLE
jgi:hypothetical protein